MLPNLFCNKIVLTKWICTTSILWHNLFGKKKKFFKIHLVTEIILLQNKTDCHQMTLYRIDFVTKWFCTELILLQNDFVQNSFCGRNKFRTHSFSFCSRNYSPCSVYHALSESGITLISRANTSSPHTYGAPSVTLVFRYSVKFIW